MANTRPFNIPKRLVWNAYLKVKSNGGAAGVDKETLELFDEKRSRNLYKIWNRMSSGSYLPDPVKSVPIPKKSGGMRVLGIPTITDRIAQMTVKQVLDSVLEPIFHENSYGYREGKSAHDALTITRKRCWQYSWGIEFDIKGCFDNISHELLNKALGKHKFPKWVRLYLERWLKAPILDKSGIIIERHKGIPQGGVVSPCLMNLFLHYVFDAWMKREFPEILICRYADDGLLHCKSLKQAEFIMEKLKHRFKECGLELNEAKTKIFYCKDSRKNLRYKNVSFDFLGYTFRPRRIKGKHGEDCTGFLPAVSNRSMRSMKQTIRGWKIQLKSEKSLEDISNIFDPVLTGWSNYYGYFYKSAMDRVWSHFNYYLVRWAMHKHKLFRGHKTKASKWLEECAQKHPDMFPHWKRGFYAWAG
jgi:RNA-directed DNA polymerase